MPTESAVWVTGLGAVCCLGGTVREFWTGLLAGRCGLAPITRFDLEGSPYGFGGEAASIPPPEPGLIGASLGARFAVAACREAADGLTGDQLERTMLVLSSNFGPGEVLEGLLDERFETPLCGDVRCGLLDGPFQWDLDCAARALGTGGERVAVSLSCSSGNAALACALGALRSGRAERALVGGYDSIQKVIWAGLGSLRIMAVGQDGGPPRVRPFDLDRGGTLFSEGAGVLLLETAEAANDRGAEPLAVLAGAFANNNAYHMTHADKEGMATAEAIAMALTDGEVDADTVCHLNAHGTGTKLNDAIEARAVSAVFGPRTGSISVTSLKGGLGHAMGAAASLEAVACVLTISEGLVPPTVGLEDLDPECAELDVVRGAPREFAPGAVVNNSAGIGGGNAAAVFTPVD